MTKEILQNWLREKITEEAGIQKEEVSFDKPLESYQLDSLSILTICYDLESFTGFTIDPTLFSEFKTINEITEWILSKKNR